jgi:hypothetical protein
VFPSFYINQAFYRQQGQVKTIESAQHASQGGLICRLAVWRGHRWFIPLARWADVQTT